MAFSSRIIEESVRIKTGGSQITKTAKSQINTLPDWIRPTVNDTLYSFEKVTALSSPSLSFDFSESIFKNS